MGPMNAKQIKWGLAALLIGAACAAPTRDFDAEQIRAVVDFEELMYVNATVADPRFKLAAELEGSVPTDAQWEEFADMAKRLQATSRQGLTFGKGDGFDAYFEQLIGQAEELGRAVEAREAEKTFDLAFDIKSTCRDCHKDYR